MAWSDAAAARRGQSDCSTTPGEIRDLKATVATYANQIQILALRNADLEADNQRLRARADRADADVIHLADRV